MAGIDEMQKINNHAGTRRLFLLLIPMVLLSWAAQATTYYVAPTGSNENSGTIEEPWATPAYAANQLQPGDMLIIREGDMHLCAAAIRLYGRTYLPHLPGIREEISGKALADRYYITYTPGAFIASKTQAFVIGTDHALWRNAHTTYSAATFEGRAHKSQIC
jgi:hypothetical protein